MKKLFLLLIFVTFSFANLDSAIYHTKKEIEYAKKYGNTHKQKSLERKLKILEDKKSRGYKNHNQSKFDDDFYEDVADEIKDLKEEILDKKKDLVEKFKDIQEAREKDDKKRVKKNQKEIKKLKKEIKKLEKELYKN